MSPRLQYNWYSTASYQNGNVHSHFGDRYKNLLTRHVCVRDVRGGAMSSVYKKEVVRARALPEGRARFLVGFWYGYFRGISNPPSWHEAAIHGCRPVPPWVHST